VPGLCKRPGIFIYFLVILKDRMNLNGLTIQALWKQADFTPNPNQEEAIQHVDGPLYLPAGPGSGKTRVLLWRTLNLIVFHGANPEEIYLSTFTEKAALQLNEGLRFLLSMVTNRTGQPYDISRMYVGTIHSLCHRILTDRRFSGQRRRHQQPSLLDELGQYFYISRAGRWSSLVEGLDLGDELETINLAINEYFDYPTPSRHQAVVNTIALFNRLSEECIDPVQVIPVIGDGKFAALLKMYDRYLKSLAEEGAVPRNDFSLMQRDAYRALEACPGSERVFKHVIIDEYQDTNTIQEKLIFKLGGGFKNICVVGDDDQALYRFRGATVENFVDFPEKCMLYLGSEPKIIPLDTNYRSRLRIVRFYSAFINCCNWSRNENPHLLHRVPKNIEAHRQDNGPSVVASMPGHPDDICPQIADFVKQLLVSGKVENENQIAFLFPSLKSDKVHKLRAALEALGLKVYAPRAGRFLEVEEAHAVFGVFLQIFGKPTRGEYPGRDYNDFFNWIDQAYADSQALLQDDPLLSQFVQDRKAEIANACRDYQALTSLIERRGWKPEQPYDPALMKRALYTLPGLSDHARRNIASKYFEKLAEFRRGQGRPVSLSYVVIRSTSVDWNILDLFYRLTAFRHFKAMFDLAEAGSDEGPICNLSLISQYLARFMDEYRSVISADLLLEDRYQHWLFGSFLYAIFRLGESEYEDAEDPFPKGRIPFLTIHQAKGLEFPVVVFGNPRKSNKGVQKVEEIVHPLLERQGEPLERIPEFDMMRLFYVALSRAKNLLVIPHWQSRGNYVSKPLKSLLEEESMSRIPDFDLEGMPAAKLEKDDLPKNYSYTADYLHYQKCPRQYMIFRKYGFVPSRSQTMFFGSLVHRTLEDLHHFLIGQREAK
jgi:DNA helicase-2/ATP-dependent DNA helicase PcrA